MKTLKASKFFEIRFSEIDSMKVAWHGSYVLYLEDAREFWGAKYGLGYQDFMDNRYYAPIVEMDIRYKKPLFYGMKARIDIIYQPTISSKIVFDYEIYNFADDSLIATAHTVQVFIDTYYELVLDNPDFYQEWKEKWSVL
jgi:acyl-CoA thioester hydrolase